MRLTAKAPRGERAEPLARVWSGSGRICVCRFETLKSLAFHRRILIFVYSPYVLDTRRMRCVSEVEYSFSAMPAAAPMTLGNAPLRSTKTVVGRQSIRAARHDGNGCKRVDGLTVLVESCPFDPSNTLGLCLRRREFDHLPFKVEPIARAYRSQPPQFVNTNAQERVRSEWPHFHCQPHRNRRCMPSRSSEAFK